MELGAIGWFTSILSDIHNEMFGVPIRWNYEISHFEATRERRPLPIGWCNVWNANPELLLKRGYDKVICLQKSLNDAIYSMVIYHHPEQTFDWLMRQTPEFFLPIKEKWQKLERFRSFTHDRFLFVHVDDLNTFPKKYFNKVFDFLGFPKENRPKLLPIKCYRDWECYSNISRSPKDQFHGQLPKIKELYLRDLNLKMKEVLEKNAI